MKSLKELQLFDDDVPLKEDKTLMGRDYLLNPDVSPYIVYSLLKEYFGEPNCYDVDEEKQQWEWTFKYKEFYISIYDWRLLSTSIAIHSLNENKSRGEKLAEVIHSLLKKEGLQKKNKIKTLIKNSKHKVLENPFITYYSTAKNLLDVASFIDKIVTTNVSQIFKEEQGKIVNSTGLNFELWHKQNDLYRSSFLMFLSSFEGFLNIMYELYLKPELRVGRIYERIAREQIDIKLRIAPIYCDGLKAKIINNEDERFKAFLRLVNLRNDYVHANLIKSLERYVVEEDDYTFIVENEEFTDIPSNINKIELKHVELVKTIIDNVIELVFESMKPNTKREFKKLIYSQEIEMIEEDGSFLPA